MKIKLKRTGGFIPITKVAEADVDMSEQELALLRDQIQSSPDAPRIKDGTVYELAVGSDLTPIDLDKVPNEYKAIFEKLKKDLKILK